MREEVLRMTHVTCRGQGSTSLRDLNLNIFAGEIMGLIPLNGGRGMTVLIDLLRRNLPLQRGNIYYREELINTWRAAAPTTTCSHWGAAGSLHDLLPAELSGQSGDNAGPPPAGVVAQPTGAEGPSAGVREQTGDRGVRFTAGQALTQQKYDVVYLRILRQNPKVVFCIQPFQGADMELRIHIWKLREQVLEKGAALVILDINLADSLSAGAAGTC